jgi:hypothetical protein
MSGKRITIEQVKFYMSNRKQSRTQAQASAKTGVSERSARRIEHGEVGVLQRKERHWRTRADPFAGVWEEEIVSRLERQPRLDATTLFEDLQERHPGEYGNGKKRIILPIRANYFYDQLYRFAYGNYRFLSPQRFLRKLSLIQNYNVRAKSSISAQWRN